MLTHTISFRHALTGIWVALTTQANIRIHFLIASAVLATAVFYHTSAIELLVLVLTIGLVMVAEMINTALEFLSNAVTLEKNEHIKHAKDVAAGAVLLSAVFAALVGLMIFLPKMI